MKNNKLIIITLAFAALINTACNETSFLDEKNPNKQVTQDFWKTESDALAALATIYSPVRGQMYGNWGGFTGFQNMNVRADDTWALVDDPETWKITTFINTPGTDRYDFDKMYKSILRSNIFLANINKVSMDEVKKNTMIGEALFLRGLNYFLLVNDYGAVPLRLKTVSNSSEIYLACSPEADIWKQIESDFSAAKDLLPLERVSAELGRITKGAAIAFLGKTYLYQKKYDKAASELKPLLSAPYKYDLMANFEDNFTPANENNKESIFELIYDKYGSGSWGSEGVNDTQGIILSQMIGTPATGGWFKLMPTTTVIDEFLAEQRPSGSDSKFDKRMYTSFFFKYSDFNDAKPDEKWYGNNFDMAQLWASTQGKRETGKAPDYSKYGANSMFLIKKFTNFYKNDKNGDSMYGSVPIDNNLRIMRFAEVLLMYAEAAVKANNLPDAATAVNRIRVRAGLPEKTWGDATDLMNEIMHQNMLEFFFEGHRFYDLKRWYSYAEMKNVFIKNNKQGAANFEPKHLYYPIPQGEVNTNTALSQNPLWK